MKILQAGSRRWSFQTVLSIVGVAFSAFEMYKRFHSKSSSGSVQNTISPQSEPKNSGGKAGAKLGALSDSGAGESQAGAKLGAPTSETPRSDVSSKIGMV